MGPNFELTSELQLTRRRDFPLADSTLLNPYNANPLVDGEFLELDTNGLQLKRGSGSGVLAVYPLHTERGRYDTQAIGKVTILMGGEYEAETSVFKTDDTYVPGTQLVVADVTFQGLTRRGLKAATGAAGEIIVGFVTKPVAGGKLRFQHMANQKTA